MCVNNTMNNDELFYYFLFYYPWKFSSKTIDNIPDESIKSLGSKFIKIYWQRINRYCVEYSKKKKKFSSQHKQKQLIRLIDNGDKLGYI